MSAESSVHPAILGCLQVLDRCTLVLDRIPESLYTKCEPPSSRLALTCVTQSSISCVFWMGLRGLKWIMISGAAMNSWRRMWLRRAG